jgi:hypothetical protein
MNLSDLQQPAWSRAEFEARLREKGKAYHIHHPMNVLLNSGAPRASRSAAGWPTASITR